MQSWTCQVFLGGGSELQRQVLRCVDESEAQLSKHRADASRQVEEAVLELEGKLEEQSALVAILLLWKTFSHI